MKITNLNNFFKEKGVKIIVTLPQKLMRQSFLSIKSFNLSRNKWVKKSITSMALKSPLQV